MYDGSIYMHIIYSNYIHITPIHINENIFTSSSNPVSNSLVGNQNLSFVTWDTQAKGKGVKIRLEKYMWNRTYNITK